MEFQFKNEYKFEDLLNIMEILRGKNGCPWDREQTHSSIRNSLVEETYEAVEAIDLNNREMLCEELGDVLLQVVFHAQIAKENGEFDINAVADGICKKLVVRHPHVFGDTSVNNSDDVIRNWDAIKYQTKKYDSLREQLDGVSKALPSLIRAQKLQKRADNAGKLTDEMFSLDLGDPALTAYARELFSLANKARLEKIDLEEALSKYNAQLTEQF
ncbi:MAG: MazG family protein [Firmicutes bacterium]|nr:MazG family protein [Bacillota bacterium]